MIWQGFLIKPFAEPTRSRPRPDPYPSLKFTANFRPEYVRQRWDALLWGAATLKSGWVTSSLQISKLRSYASTT